MIYNEIITIYAFHLLNIQSNPFNKIFLKNPKLKPKMLVDFLD